MQLKDFTIVCGHYGCGKTNFSLNLALDAAKNGKHVTLVDLDLINPYFRSSEYGGLLAENGIRMIAPVFANTNLDIPSISPAIASVFEEDAGTVIIDLGGDDAGAAALGSFHASFKGLDYDMLYVINRYRILSTEAEEAEALLREIETACRLKATGIVNNSHLKSETTPQLITDSLEYAADVAKLLKLPLLCTTAPRGMEKYLEKIPDLYPVDIHVRSPWEIN